MGVADRSNSPARTQIHAHIYTYTHTHTHTYARAAHLIAVTTLMHPHTASDVPGGMKNRIYVLDTPTRMAQRPCTPRYLPHIYIYISNLGMYVHVCMTEHRRRRTHTHTHLASQADRMCSTRSYYALLLDIYTHTHTHKHTHRRIHRAGERKKARRDSEAVITINTGPIKQTRTSSPTLHTHASHAHTYTHIYTPCDVHFFHIELIRHPFAAHQRVQILSHHSSTGTRIQKVLISPPTHKQIRIYPLGWV